MRSKYETALTIILIIAASMLIMTTVVDLFKNLEKDLSIAMIGVIGSVIGGMVGGFFTYLGVKMTLDKQSENEIPMKLICLNKSLNLINDYDVTIMGEYDFVLNQTKLNGTVSNEIIKRIRKVLDQYEGIKDDIVNEVAHVNGKTYKIMQNRFLHITLGTHHDTFLKLYDFENEPSVENQMKLIDLLFKLHKDFENLRVIVSQQSFALEKIFK
jgi:hypothetical protein